MGWVRVTLFSKEAFRAFCLQYFFLKKGRKRWNSLSKCTGAHIKKQSQIALFLSPFATFLCPCCFVFCFSIFWSPLPPMYFRDPLVPLSCPILDSLSSLFQRVPHLHLLSPLVALLFFTGIIG